MKIGLSYSRCIRDIVEGKVDIEDVLVVIARTDFNPHNDEQWQGIWQGYGGGSGITMRGIFSGTNPEWSDFGDEAEVRFREVTKELYDSGRMHQPRQFGAHPRRMPYYWLEAVLPSEELDQNPSLKKAWNNFQVLAGLSSVTLDKESA